MANVYMDNNLGQLKSILDTAKNLQIGNIKVVTTLNGLIQRYNQIARNIDNTQELPFISPYDENLDIDFFHTSLTTSGTSKLTDIITYAEGYVNAHTPIPSIVVEGWSGKKFWGLTAFVVTSCIAICAIVYQIGFSNGKSETQREYDAEKITLSQKIDSLKTKYYLTNDSLKTCNINVIAKNDSLEECNTSIVAKKDSISFLLSKDKQTNKNKKGSAK